MKRRAPVDLKLRPSRFESDPKKAYSVDQLSEIGAISIRWNQLESLIDFIATFILFNKNPFWLRLSVSSSLTANKKLDLLKECLKNAELLDDSAKQCIFDCFAVSEQCRKYRNAIIHHHIYDHDKGIGSFIDLDGSPHQILVSLEALSVLYLVLCKLLEELQEIDLLFRIETDAQTPGHFNKETGTFEKFGDEKLKRDIIPNHVKKIKKLQKSRIKIMCELPKFPDAGDIGKMNGSG